VVAVRTDPPQPELAETAISGLCSTQAPELPSPPDPEAARCRHYFGLARLLLVAPGVPRFTDQGSLMPCFLRASRIAISVASPDPISKAAMAPSRSMSTSVGIASTLYFDRASLPLASWKLGQS
jgi:hypothetical protein